MYMNDYMIMIISKYQNFFRLYGQTLIHGLHVTMILKIAKWLYDDEVSITCLSNITFIHM